MKSTYIIYSALRNPHHSVTALVCIFAMSILSCQQMPASSTQEIEHSDFDIPENVSAIKDSVLYDRSIEFRETFFQYLRTGNYNSASLMFQQELANYEMSNDPCLQFEYLYKIMPILYHQKDYQPYIYYSKKLYETILKCDTDDPYNRSKKFQNTLANLGIAYLDIQQPDSAYQAFSSALELNQTDKQLYNDLDKHLFEMGVLEFYLYGNLGRAYLALGDTLKAEQYWKQSINLADGVEKTNNFAFIIRLRLANLYTENNRFDEAEQLIALVKIHQLERPSDLTEERLLESQWKLYDQSGQTEAAYQAYMNYIQLLDKNDKERANELRFSLVQEIRIAYEKHRAELLEAETRLKSIYLLLGLIVILTFTLFLVITYLNKNRYARLANLLKKLNKDITLKNRTLKKKNARINILTKTLVHDLRSPIFGIKYLAYNQITDSPISDPRVNEIFEAIYESSQHSEQMISDVLENEDEDLTELPVIKKTDWKQFLTECRKANEPKANSKNQCIYLSCPPLSEGYFDPIKMRRAINNLLDNAIKFSPEKSDIRMSIEEEFDYFEITISDDGVGIPDHLQNELFEYETPHKNTGTHNEKSHGMGLYITREIVEAHGGTISYQSSDTGGTTFIIRLPFEDHTYSQIP